MSPVDPQAFINASAQVSSWRRPLLISHTNPDGDALGSLLAMRALLRRPGVSPMTLLFDPIPTRYDLVKRYEPMPVLGTDCVIADLSDIDGVIVVDTCAYAQLDPIADWLRASSLPKLVVDHHVTRDMPADTYLIDESAAATSLILYDWARAVEWTIDQEVAEAMFVGIAMDTGWFRHSNTDHRALACAADLVVRGVNPHEFYARLFQCESPARVRLLGAALATLDLPADGRLAVMTLSPEAFTAAGASRADTEDIVNEPMRIGSVLVSALLVDHGDGIIRTSLRSKPAADADSPEVDVSATASALGGGGHRRAAAARIPGTLAHVRKTIIEQLTEALAQGPA